MSVLDGKSEEDLQSAGLAHALVEATKPTQEQLARLQMDVFQLQCGNIRLTEAMQKLVDVVAAQRSRIADLESQARSRDANGAPV